MAIWSVLSRHDPSSRHGSVFSNVEVNLLHCVGSHDLAKHHPIAVYDVHRRVVKSYDAGYGFFHLLRGLKTGKLESFLLISSYDNVEADETLFCIDVSFGRISLHTSHTAPICRA